DDVHGPRHARQAPGGVVRARRVVGRLEIRVDGHANAVPHGEGDVAGAESESHPSEPRAVEGGVARERQGASADAGRALADGEARRVEGGGELELLDRALEA